MRTSLNEVLAIENHLFNTGAPEDALVFEAKTILDPQLLHKTTAQQQTYRLIRLYGSRQLKAELETVHQKLFTKPEYRSFAQRVRKLFGLT